MSENRATIAALVVGLLIGAVVGLAIGAMLQITSDQWWALAGSAVGAVLAIFGAVLVFHYQSREAERADRRSIAQQIDAALGHVRAFDRAASFSVPRSSDM